MLISLAVLLTGVLCHAVVCLQVFQAARDIELSKGQSAAAGDHKDHLQRLVQELLAEGILNSVAPAAATPQDAAGARTQLNE
jgi:hypothetical protein